MKNLTALAAILTYSRKVVVASNDEMAAVCYDEDELAQILPGVMFDPCGFKPQNSDARKCCTDSINVSFWKKKPADFCSSALGSPLRQRLRPRSEIQSNQNFGGPALYLLPLRVSHRFAATGLPRRSRG